VDSKAWWEMKASAFVRAVRRGGRWASNEPIKQMLDSWGKVVRIDCVGCGRPVTEREYLEDRCDGCGQTGQAAIRLERMKAKMRAIGARAQRRVNDLVMDKLDGGE
jgi:hypothetical protein